jgi:flagellar biosynthesis anti-sigma factor FlgM
MKIPEGNVSGLNSPAANGADRTQAVTGANTRAKAAAAGSSIDRDAVQLSNFAQQVNDLQDGSPAREARVLELQQLVRSGQYSADARATAGRLIDDAISG